MVLQYFIQNETVPNFFNLVNQPSLNFADKSNRIQNQQQVALLIAKHLSLSKNTGRRNPANAGHKCCQ